MLLKKYALALSLASLLACALPAWALPADLVLAVAAGESDERIAAVAKLVASGDSGVEAYFQSLLDGEVQVAGGKRVLIVKDRHAVDAATGEKVEPLPENLDDALVNNRLRGTLEGARSALKLSSPDRAARLTAVKALEDGAREEMLPLIGAALARETDPQIRQSLTLVQAGLQLKSADAAVRLAAVKALAQSDNPNTKMLLLALLEKKGDVYAEPDAAVRAEAQDTLKAVQSQLSSAERFSQIFTGISLGSILLLAALGLAITYGLMGVINMAHGELIMVGAYGTYLVQNLFRAQAPALFDWYLLAAVPVAFFASAIVGMALERSVIRYLYGRPLETLLATWGISLILIQTVRTLFGAQNVQVENPVWMSGGVEIIANVLLPWNRVVIIGFALAVLLLVWVLLARTRLGLFVRAVTQNRGMASCVGVPTARVDTLAFGLGSGIAGLAGCALSQIGNVGPDLGQTYIVDSFMVVVLGGVGQLAGTVYAALGLGMANKFLEGWSGAVLAKIAILAFIIIFIQKRPQGLFALKGRMADA
ncbi:MAG: urea ABC transporter permease subunit UrtB [Betaproteobacteria bacterium]|nr:MAG: urea ABC transporter permease subunit UrtB [Betaproteobacteria bacterium]